MQVDWQDSNAALSLFYPMLLAWARLELALLDMDLLELHTSLHMPLQKTLQQVRLFHVWPESQDKLVCTYACHCLC